ncbi:MAG: hypothetical protein AAFO98_02965 [Pseudomonadota bacterium]
MPRLSKDAVSHDTDFVDIDIYLEEMSQRIEKLRSLVPTRASAAPAKTKSKGKLGNRLKRRLKSGASI